MRYSLYVYLNQMSHVLLEAADYMGAHPDATDVPELFGTCKELLQSLADCLHQNQASISDPSLLTTLDQTQQAFQSLAQVHTFASNAAQLSQQIFAGIQYRFRVLFLAELGEKWDALESVYQAFCARSDCDPIVVQMPVHRVVERDGKQEVEVLYQDYLSGLEVPFEEYHAYDIQRDCPDLTFHTNPYESTIPFEYWPENLSKYTRLVYVPYYTDFTVDETVIQSHFVQPMARYAWKIVGMSEKMRRLHQKHAPRQGENLMVTGLPKWDHILHMPQQVSVPEWSKKLDGKTVFLWNSHFNMTDNSTLLQNGPSILELFSKRKDIALIWRPHPMTETILKLYLPPEAMQLWEKMNQTVLESDNMVLDKNPLCDAGFQNSHALISDRSSLMVQYMLTGKPVLWLKNTYQSSEKPVIDVSCLESAKKPGDIVAFIDRIQKGIDRTSKQRGIVLAQDMALADGHCGARVCEQTIAAMLAEDFATESEQTEEQNNG